MLDWFWALKVNIVVLLNFLLPVQRLEVQFQIQILVHWELDAVHIRGYFEFEIDVILPVVVPLVTHYWWIIRKNILLLHLLYVQYLLLIFYLLFFCFLLGNYFVEHIGFFYVYFTHALLFSDPKIIHRIIRVDCLDHGLVRRLLLVIDGFLKEWVIIQSFTLVLTAQVDFNIRGNPVFIYYLIQVTRCSPDPQEHRAITLCCLFCVGFSFPIWESFFGRCCWENASVAQSSRSDRARERSVLWYWFRISCAQKLGKIFEIIWLLFLNLKIRSALEDFILLHVIRQGTEIIGQL